MDITTILAQLRSERERIDQAITALQSLDGITPEVKHTRRPMSAAARKRIGEAARKRWAARRKATK